LLYEESVRRSARSTRKDCCPAASDLFLIECAAGIFMREKLKPGKGALKNGIQKCFDKDESASRAWAVPGNLPNRLVA
jgi:hypothetical protein